MSLLAETSVLLADTGACARLYRLLLPWPAFNAVDVAEGFRGNYAQMLRARDLGGDAERADQLHEQAEATSLELGLQET